MSVQDHLSKMTQNVVFGQRNNFSTSSTFLMWSPVFIRLGLLLVSHSPMVRRNGRTKDSSHRIPVVGNGSSRGLHNTLTSSVTGFFPFQCAYDHEPALEKKTLCPCPKAFYPLMSTNLWLRSLHHPLWCIELYRAGQIICNVIHSSWISALRLTERLPHHPISARSAYD